MIPRVTSRRLLLPIVLLSAACRSVETEAGTAEDSGEQSVVAELQNAPPNFVFILADDLRVDALGFVQKKLSTSGRFGFFKNSTPAIDGLVAAPSSMVFENAMVVKSLCSPSRAAF